MPEYCYSPEAEDFSRKTKIIEEVLITTQEVMLRLLMSLLAPEKLILSPEARSAFLKDSEAVKFTMVIKIKRKRRIEQGR